ncbi:MULTISPECIES: proteasome assembly chaperone family protein [Haloarcula]|uniref:Proteasome assembly chaperone family protein n=1 Tax=Haloarcula pellucida TaxID=1427151 RepID=A0A830GH81_9EURY|nr:MULTISPECIES: proteasome assembly chaperone family protein [Halomicroarcula]MBX0347037.1 proteasome assembly chaperone family protein [Halomicroarcula pellucida]MDS0277088.1 proteasome assembly chaperone family protein [Halomicroarcula sp. S1AR25-4]GGN86666.1 proteasome assembly chaperone family protein [Halomicroarcula pellucida]
MDEFDIEVLADPDLEDPVLVEGLPGVGHVGKLAAEHLLEELESELVRRVYSTHFPPQVSIDDRTAQLACAEFHAVTPEEGRDMLVLSGDHQAQDSEGHYGLTDAFLDVGEDFGVGEVFALGGVPTGELIEEYDVLGATTTDEFADTLEDSGVVFREDEPAGGIVGVSGLLLGLGGRRDITAACLMGETSGYLVDPKSAQAVLEILQDVVGFDVDYESLEERADEMEEVVRKIQEMEQQNAPSPADEDLRYIG